MQKIENFSEAGWSSDGGLDFSFCPLDGVLEILRVPQNSLQNSEVADLQGLVQLELCGILCKLSNPL